MRILRHAGLALSLLAGPAWGQTTPSTADIIAKLRFDPATSNGATRGIRPGVAAPSAGLPQAGQLIAQRTAPSIDLVVAFATNSAELSSEARAALGNLGAALASRELAGNRFRIEGHTDTVGTAEANVALSTRRAEAVAAFLVDGYRLDRADLQTLGLGFSQPAVATAPGVDEPRNRRVRVVNITRTAIPRCGTTQRCR